MGMMTNEQGQRLRVLLQEAFDVVLGKPVAFVLVMQDQQHALDIVSNSSDREALGVLLGQASTIVRTPPDATIAIPDHRAAGESAEAAVTASGMECGHAAPGALQPADHGRGVDGAAQPTAGSREVATTPPAAAVSERCAVKDGEEQCPHQAAGGLRVNLHATPAIQKRYGKRVMLSLIFDLPVCLACFPKLTPANLMSDDQWRAFSKVAQQRNSGILADRGQTEIVLCRFEDPEYVALRQQIERQRASNDGAAA
jgi:hypothetical protein